MNEQVVKRYYLVSGIFFAFAVLSGIIRLFDIILGNYNLDFLNIVAIIFLALSLLTMVTLLIHSYLVDKQKAKEELRKKDDSEKLQKYVSKKIR